MKIRVTKKENGVVTDSTREILTNNKSFVVAKDKIFEGVISDISDKKDLIKTYRNMIYFMINELLTNAEGEELIYKIYNQIKVAKTYENLTSIVSYFYEMYMEYIKEVVSKKESARKYKTLSKANNYDKYMNENMDIIVSIFVKKIISSYYYQKISKLSKIDFQLLLEYREQGKYELMLALLQDENLSNDNGLLDYSYKVISDMIDRVYDNKQLHLCWEYCDHACPSECPKVRDVVKNHIDYYDFITDGYELYDAYGEVEKFVVTGCKLYEYTPPKKLSRAELARIQKIQEKLVIDYFEAGSLEEAYSLQESMTRRGLLLFKEYGAKVRKKGKKSE